MRTPKLGETFWRQATGKFETVVFTDGDYYSRVYPVLVPKADNPYGMSFEDALTKYAPGREMEDFAWPAAYPMREYITACEGICMSTPFDDLPRIILKPKPKKVQVTVEIGSNKSVFEPGMRVRLQDADLSFGTIYSCRVVAVSEV
jgi:hypothetical protein